MRVASRLTLAAVESLEGGAMELAFEVLKRGGLDVTLCLHTAEPVPAREWDALIARLQRLAKTGVPDTENARMRMLVVSDGGAPDARQRTQLGALWGGRTVPTAVLVPAMTNPIKRGLMTALHWFNPKMAFFTPPQLREALVHVGLERELPALWSEFLDLQRQLPPVRTLQLIAECAHLPWSGAGVAVR